MLETLEWDQLTPQAHLLIWSRIDWMLQLKDANMRAFLEPVTVNLLPGTKAEIVTVQVERATAGFVAGFGRTPEQCEAEWRAWVLKTYGKK
jgi:hypothetical protein